MTSSPEGEGGDKPKDDEWWHDDEEGGKVVKYDKHISP